MKTSRADDIRAYILDNVESNPTGIATQTAKRFRITRPGVHRHLNTLIESGQLAKIGRRRKTRYARTTERQQAWSIDRAKITTVADAWEITCARKLRVFKSNVIDLLQWGFCQILYNALEYTDTPEPVLFYEFSGRSIHLSILDEGPGIFNHICDNHQLTDLREAALLLMKGPHAGPAYKKLGQGLFWCSKLFDSVLIRANGLEFCQFGVDDWYLDNAPTEAHAGTFVQISLDIATTKTLASVLKPGGTCPADRRHLFVKMLQLDQEVYLTKADAQRLLFDLDEFKEIVIDFKMVRNVGHSFISEIFCRFKSAHPDVDISYVNASANVKFMIARCLSSASSAHKQIK